MKNNYEKQPLKKYLPIIHVSIIGKYFITLFSEIQYIQTKISPAVSLSKNQKNKSKNNRVQQKTVCQIENSSDSGNRVSGIFDPAGSFDTGFRKVSSCSENK